MNKLTILFGLIILPAFLLSQEQRNTGHFQLVITEKGKGIVDTRIDNMGYWRLMVEQGMVVPDPVIRVPEAIYTGSGIDNTRSLTTTDSPDVPVASTSSTQSENSIFVDPTDELNVLNSNNSTTNPVGSLYGADYLLSADGGETWGGSVNGAGGGNSGDPSTSISLTGRMYVGFINSSYGQSIAYSANGGSTWTAVQCGVYNGGMLDKNHMWIDNSPTSSYEGNVYSAWTDFGSTNTNQIMVTRSADDGLTYSTPVNVSAAVLAGSHNQGVNISTGPNGEVYLIWAIYDGWPTDESAIGFAKSTNGGTSYAAGTRIISNIKGIRNTTAGKNQRVNSFPSMTVDISNGPNRGNIYVTWANVGVPGTNTGTDVDVYMIRSTNGGTSWSSPIRINQDPIGQGKKHYFPWITCDPVTGDLSAIFYDDRNVSSTQCEVYCANSYDGGSTWENFKVSDVAFTPAPIPNLADGYMGDYLGISSRNGKVYPVWPDNRSGTVMTYCSPYDLNPLPDANFSASTTTPCLNQTVTFTDLTNKSPVSWSWTITPSTVLYVNGTSSSSQNPQVQFQAYGNYSIQLDVTNAYGSGTISKPNYISVNFSNANFTASNTTPVINTEVTFTDLSSCNISSYSWNFGANATPASATTQGPHTVIYSATGLKTISLTVNGNVTETKTNYINVLPMPTYCSAGSSYTNCDEYIARVQIGSIDNTTTCSSPGGYGNYTSLSTKVSPTYSYSITITNGMTIYTGDQCGIWADWNWDGDFSDANETMTVTGTPGVGPYTATIVPPATALKGNTRLRIRITWTGAVSPCGTTTYGEVEDYTLHVGTPGLWNGGTSGSPTDWNTANNWDDGRVPTSTIDVIIPAGLSYYPVVSGSYSCDDLNIRDNSTLTVQPGATINVNGNLNVGQGVSGTLNINGSTCNVTGQINVSTGGTVNVSNGGQLKEN
jgi:PKD repeat protein